MPVKFHNIIVNGLHISYTFLGQEFCIFKIIVLAEYCIRQTGLDAVAAGYRVILMEDAIGTGDDVQYRREAVFAELAQKGGILLNTADCLKL